MLPAPFSLLNRSAASDCNVALPLYSTPLVHRQKHAGAASRRRPACRPGAGQESDACAVGQERFHAAQGGQLERLDLLPDSVRSRPARAGLDAQVWRAKVARNIRRCSRWPDPRLDDAGPAFIVLGVGGVAQEAVKVGDGSVVVNWLLRAFAHVSTPWSAVQ
jgi:hypothetical protein